MAGGVTRELAARLGAALLSPARTLAAAESCTGGAFSAAVTDVPGASAWFLGGVVAYSNASKVRDLGVPQTLIDAAGAVSEDVAVAMAEGAKRRFGADIGVGITGIAGPGGATPGKPVGTVCVAVAAGEVRLSNRFCLPGDRLAVRADTVVRALEAVLAVAESGRRRGR
ncbi:MAG: CinA family protein [Deltaproteobacteria bacterium]